MIKLDMLIHH